MNKQPRRHIRAALMRITQGAEWRTLPNYITFARIALLPLLLVLLANRQFAAAFALSLVVFASDWADGYLARRTGAVSPLGTWLDPVADRLAVFVVAIGFGLGHVVPWEYVALLVVPDIILGVFAVTAFRGAPEVSVSRVGKLRTALIFTGFAAMLFGMALDEHDIAFAGSFVGWGFLTALVGLVGHYIVAVVYARAMFVKRRAGRRQATSTS